MQIAPSRWSFLASAILLATATPAHAAAPVPAAEVRTALADTSRAIHMVVLDEKGRARGDYHLTQGEWREYEAAWHTGQAILGLLAAHEVLVDPELLTAARRAGDWWIAQRIGSGRLAGLVNAAHGDRLGRLINFTTITNGTPGLFALTRATGDRRYGDVAAESIRWLNARTAVPSDPGLFYNIIDPDSGAIWRDRSPHHDVPRASLTQVARPNIEGSPFLDLCRHSGERLWCDRHHDQALRTAARQHDSGFWMDFEPNEPDSGRVHPRFNSWNAEAMLTAYRERRDPRLLAAALRTARANVRLMQADGAFHYDNNLDGRRGSGGVTASATAFAGLLWLDLRRLGHREFDPQIHAAARWLVANRFRSDHPDPNLRGLPHEFRVRSDRVLVRDLGAPFTARFLAAYLREFP